MAQLDHEVRPPEPLEMSQVQQLRHAVLDPERAMPSDEALSLKDVDPRYIHMAAFVDGIVVSTVRIDPVSDATYNVRKMATADGFRGRGFGGLVLQAAESVAIGLGARTFTLDARKMAVPFYERAGYRFRGQRFKSNDGVINFPMIKQVKHGN